VTTNTLLSRSDLELLSGASKRTISRHAEKGLIPGAYRHDKLHWHFPDSAELRLWCDLMGGNRGSRRKKPTLSKINAIRAIAAIRSHPEIFEQRPPDFEKLFEKMTEEEVREFWFASHVFKSYSRKQILVAAGLPLTLVEKAILEKESASDEPEQTTKKKLNDGLGKGTSIVTIEGIRQQFDIWKRKMGTKIEEWTISDLDKAIPLLEPFADQLQALRILREKKVSRNQL
jgi:hypothetical protein